MMRSGGMSTGSGFVACSVSWSLVGLSPEPGITSTKIRNVPEEVAQAIGVRLLIRGKENRTGLDAVLTVIF